jgi:hypothetical protein
VTESAEPAARAPFGLTLAVAAVAGAIYALGLYIIADYLKPQSGLVLVAFLFGVPVAAPSLTILIADPHGKLHTRVHAGLGALVVTAMLIAGLFALREGGICTIMAAPLFYVLGVLGAMATGGALRGYHTRLFSSVLIAFPLIALPLDNQSVYPARTETVTTTVEIAAPPQAVWRNLVEVRAIRARELVWTFTQDVAGVPKPMDARLSGRGAGAIRYVTWGRGIHFEERVTRWVENRDLAWNFHFDDASIPRAIEGHVKLNSPYLKVLDGSYHLDALANGHTSVTLRTRYWMRTPLNSYAAWWGRIFVDDFHANVLHVIRERAERGSVASR